MSIVLSYTDNDSCYMSSDGLVCDRYGNPVSSKTKKVFKVNDHVLIGFAGDFADCFNAANFLFIPSNSEKIKSLHVHEILGFFDEAIRQFNLQKAGFLVSGKDLEGKYCTGSVATGVKKSIVYPGHDEQCVFGLYPEEILPGEALFEKHLSRYYPDVKFAMYKTIQEAARRSKWVNSEMFLEHL